jgi:hypothetical protein
VSGASKQGDVAGGGARQTLHGGDEAHELFHGAVAQQLGPAAQQGLLRRVSRQLDEGIAEQADGRVLARDQQQGAEAQHFLVGQALFRQAPAKDAAHQVVGTLRLALGDDALEVGFELLVGAQRSLAHELGAGIHRVVPAQEVCPVGALDAEHLRDHHAG